MIRDVAPPQRIVAEAAALMADPANDLALNDAHAQRIDAVADYGALLRAAQPHLAQLPDARAADVHDGIVDNERWLVSRQSQVGSWGDRRVPLAEYGEGTAEYDDALAVFGQGSVLAEAGHATDPVRKATGVREHADHGTAGIAGLLAQEQRGRAIVAVGRQTSNTNTNPEHPVKKVIADELTAAPYAGFVSVHGMRFGKVISPLDPREIDAVIGLGITPSEQSILAAEELQRRAAEYGLRVVIGNYIAHLTFEPTEAGPLEFPGVSRRLIVDAEGAPVATRLAAYGPAFTTTFASQVTEGRPPISMQLEISRRLRVQAQEQAGRSDRGAERMAVFLGYRFAELATEVIDGHAMLSA